MIGAVETFLTAVSTTKSVLEALSPLVKEAKGKKRSLLLELQHNVNVIGLYTEGNSPIDKVVARLQTRHVEAALDSGFDFNLVKKGKIKKRITDGVLQYERYVGWTTEQLFSGIYLRIKELQTIVEIDPHNEQYRKDVRLLNIRKLMILLLKHIRS